MKTTFKLLVIALGILFSTPIFAQEGSGSLNVQSLTVHNQNFAVSCETVQLIVDYTYDGVSYSQISSAVAMSPESVANFSVVIPVDAIVTGKRVKFNFGEFDFVIFEVGSLEGDISGDFCSGSGMNYTGLLVNLSSSTNTDIFYSLTVTAPIIGGDDNEDDDDTHAPKEEEDDSELMP